jgi:hypothetical protein
MVSATASLRILDTYTPLRRSSNTTLIEYPQVRKDSTCFVLNYSMAATLRDLSPELLLVIASIFLRLICSMFLSHRGIYIL